MFKELFTEGDKMRTKNGFEYAISAVKKVQKFADSIGMSDSRVIAGSIMDWAKLNKVKVADIIKKVSAGEIDKALAKKVFIATDMRKLTPSGKELLDALKGKSDV